MSMSTLLNSASSAKIWNLSKVGTMVGGRKRPSEALMLRCSSPPGVDETLENFNDVADDLFRAALDLDRDHRRQAVG